jgi:hypothetical protein
MTPRPSSVRRSSKPLPATASTGEALVRRRRRSEMLMFSSLPTPCRDWYCPNSTHSRGSGEYVPLRDLLTTKFPPSAIYSPHRNWSSNIAGVLLVEIAAVSAA